MSAQLLRRPSTLVVFCAVVVVSAFVARGDLRIETDRTARNSRGSEPTVVRSHAPVPRRAVEHAVVTGRVLDALGYAVAGAEVEAVAGVSATTGPDGRFELSLAKAAFADLWVRGEGYCTRWLRASMSSPDPLVVQLELQAPWDPAPVVTASPALTGEGTVRDEAGAPLAGAYVTAVGSGLWSRTDEIGRYTLPLYSSTPTLLVHGSNGEATAAGRSGPLRLDRDRGIVPLPELVAQPAGTIRGTLRDSAGDPVAGVPVVIEGEGVYRICESGTSGRFRLRGLVPGRYEIRPHPWSGAFGRTHEVVLDGPVGECELQLEPLQAKKLQVCRENGSPVGNAYVAVILGGSRSGVTRADDDGWAEVALAPGAVQFEVRDGDGASELAVRGFDSEQTRLVVAAP